MATISIRSSVDPTVVRRRVGMVFQKSNPFPTMTIGENVIIGLRLNGVHDQKFLNERLEKSLRMAALWDEVKERFAQAWHKFVGWPATATMYCPNACCGAGSGPDG